MKKIISIIYIILFVATIGKAADVVELSLPKSNKVVIKLMFRAGSICDPKGKEGLTVLTANTIIDGGTQKMSSSEVKDFIYPMAAQYFVTVDKEVTYFTFNLQYYSLLSCINIYEWVVSFPEFPYSFPLLIRK